MYLDESVILNIDNNRSNFDDFDLIYVVKIMILNDFEMVLVDTHPMFKKNM